MARETDRVVVRGSLRTIEYAVCANGSMPAKDFIEGLEEKEQRKLAVLFQRMADTGRISNREQFKLVRGKLYEFKRYQTRVGCFRIQDRWVLTHGFIKKTDRWPRSQIERGERIMEEHLKRENATSSKKGRRR